jgi:DNA adenine methylase
MARNAGGTRAGIKPGTGFRSNSKRSGTTPAHDWRNFAGTGFRTYTGESDGRRNRKTLPCGDWKTYGAALTPIIERLRGVVIENKDAIEVMLTHDGTKTLHYVDPPYVHSTRDKGSDYVHEMTDEDHRKLAAVLNELKGAVILSAYECPLYDELYAGWRRAQREALADGALKRTEVLWMRNVAQEITLWNQIPA